MNMINGDLGATAMEKSGMTGAVIGGVAAMTLNDWLGIAGFMLAFVSVLFQIWATWFFKTKHLKIAEARLAADLSDKDEEEHG